VAVLARGKRSLFVFTFINVAALVVVGISQNIVSGDDGPPFPGMGFVRAYPWQVLGVGLVVAVLAAWAALGSASAATVAPRDVHESLRVPIQRNLDLLRARANVDVFVGPHLTDGKPAVATLMRQVRRLKGDRILLLTGPSGAGKTSVLSQVATECARRWRRRRRPVTPVYVDLAAYVAQPVRPLRDYLAQTVTTDGDLRDRLLQAWRPGGRMIWLFLFDNLNGAPAGAGAGKLVGEIEDFLAIRGKRAKAIVAAGPEHSLPGLATAAIAPLTYGMQKRLLAAYPQLVDALPRWSTNKSFRPYLANPGWLVLLRGTPPRPGTDASSWSLYVLMTELVDRRLRAAGSVIGGADDEPLDRLAELLSATPSHAADVATVRRVVGADSLARLQRAQLVGDDHGSIRFVHPSIMVYLLARRALQGDGQIGTSTLQDGPWFVPVSVLVLGFPLDAAEVSHFVGRAQAEVTALNAKLPSAAQPPSADLSREITRTVDTLRAIDAGLQYQPELVPPELTRETRVLLEKLGSPRAWSDLSDALSAKDAAADFESQVRSRSGFAVERAAGRLATTPGAVELISIESRTRLMLLAALGGPDRFDVGPIRDRRLQLAASAGTAVAATFAATYGLSAAGQLLAIREAWPIQVVELIVVLSFSGAVIAARRYTAARRWLFAHTDFLMGLWGALALIGTVLGVTLILIALAAFSNNLVPLVFILLLTWPLAVLFYLATEPNPAVGRLAFPYPWIAGPLWRYLRS
jgi:hypothetical protein